MSPRPLTDAERAWLHHRAGGMDLYDWALFIVRVGEIVAIAWIAGYLL